MALGFFRGTWDRDKYFYIKYGENTYTDGFIDNSRFDSINKVFIGYKNNQVYHNDGSYTDNTLLIPLNILTFNDDN